VGSDCFLVSYMISEVKCWRSRIFSRLVSLSKHLKHLPLKHLTGWPDLTDQMLVRIRLGQISARFSICGSGRIHKNHWLTSEYVSSAPIVFSCQFNVMSKLSILSRSTKKPWWFTASLSNDLFTPLSRVVSNTGQKYCNSNSNTDCNTFSKPVLQY